MDPKILLPFLAVLVASVAILQFSSKTKDETPPPTEISDQELKVEAEPETWIPDIPIKKKGRQFVGLRITGRSFLAEAPDGFNQIPGQDENGNPEMLIMGYVVGPTSFEIKLPTDIKQVDVEVGIPSAGGQKFTVTQ
mgnify:CR=1 FL=1